MHFVIFCIERRVLYVLVVDQFVVGAHVVQVCPHSGGVYASCEEYFQRQLIVRQEHTELVQQYLVQSFHQFVVVFDQRSAPGYITCYVTAHVSMHCQSLVGPDLLAFWVKVGDRGV